MMAPAVPGGGRSLCLVIDAAWPPAAARRIGRRSAGAPTFAPPDTDFGRPADPPAVGRAAVVSGTVVPSAFPVRRRNRAGPDRPGRRGSPTGDRSSGSSAPVPAPCRGGDRRRPGASGRRSPRPDHPAERRRAWTTGTPGNDCESCRKSGRAPAHRSAGSRRRCSRSIVSLFWRWSAPRSRRVIDMRGAGFRCVLTRGSRASGLGGARDSIHRRDRRLLPVPASPGRSVVRTAVGCDSAARIRTSTGLSRPLSPSPLRCLPGGRRLTSPVPPVGVSSTAPARIVLRGAVPCRSDHRGAESGHRHSFRVGYPDRRADGRPAPPISG